MIRTSKPQAATWWMLSLLLAGIGVGAGVRLLAVKQASEGKAPTPGPLKGAAEPGLKDFAVHEWGVFRAYEDADMANADMRAVWEGLPKYVYGQVSGHNLPQHWENVLNADRPIIFFHAPQALDVEVRVEFPTGIPAVWWPATRSPARHQRRQGELAEIIDKKPFKSLLWRARLKEAPFQGQRAVPPLAKDDEWTGNLRTVAADDVFCYAGEEKFGFERERFLYYDGLLAREKWVALTVEKEKVAVSNQGRHAVFDLTVVDRRQPDLIRVARRPRLDAEEKQTLTFTDVAAKDWPAESEKTLLKQLTAAGLNADEAGSLLEHWRQNLFQTDGLTMFYRLPQEEYDRLLPLTVKPRPEKVVRVGLVAHPHCEPDLAERVAGLVADLEAKDFVKRQQAQKQLDSLGRAAFVHLVRLRDKTKDPDLRRNLDPLIDKYDARKAVAP